MISDVLGRSLVRRLMCDQRTMPSVSMMNVDRGGQVVAAQVVHAVGVHDIGIAVVQHRKLDADLGDDRMRSRQVVGADRQHLRSQLRDLCVVFSQLDELTPAVCSPEGAVEHQHHRVFFQGGGQREGVAGGARQLEIGAAALSPVWLPSVSRESGS